MSLLVLSGSQANGILVLLPLLFLLMISEPAWRWWQTSHWTPDPNDAALLDSLASVWRSAIPSADSSGQNQSAYAEKLKPRYFAFDPNTASAADFVSLGFQERLTQRIEHYRDRGGHFKTKEDLLKIYGMDTAQFERVYDFIKIKHEERVKSSKSRKPDFPANSYPTSKRFHAADRFDINLADTARLEAVRGIGEKLSRRIIKYRSSLGGFVDIGQLKEVFGLDSGVVKELEQIAFVAPDFLPDRIDINVADEKLLEAHPYLSRQEARAIVAYRFQHGNFATVEDLRKISLIDEKAFLRIKPYTILE